jgi:hypothetical protein
MRKRPEGGRTKQEAGLPCNICGRRSPAQKQHFQSSQEKCSTEGGICFLSLPGAESTADITKIYGGRFNHRIHQKGREVHVGSLHVAPKKPNRISAAKLSEQ